MENGKYKKCQLKILTESVRAALTSVGSKYCLDEGEFLHRVLQQLPKFTDSELSEKRVISKEIEHIARKIKEVKKKYKRFTEPPNDMVTLANLTFAVVPRREAGIVNEKFHYIGYNRTESFHMGLFAGYQKNRGKLASMITLSPFDLSHVKPLPIGLDSRNVLVVSRVFAFDWAPRNCISFMMGRTFRWLRKNKRSVKLLLTYLNPNSCFTGTSYEASNWVLFGVEPNLHYAYLDGEYVTLRALREGFSTDHITSLQETLGNRLQLSHQPLEPLRLYAYYLDKNIKSFREPKTFKKVPPIA
jgi:hypothetical protein